MALFDHINRVEREWSFYNKKALQSEFVLSWAERLGIYVSEDRTVPEAISFNWENQRTVLYNPHLPEGLKTLTLGHELGHILLGHLGQQQQLSFTHKSLFTRRGKEKDASIIGYLSLIPNPLLHKLADQNRLDPEELYWELQPWGELEEGFGWEICKARVRIYDALIRIQAQRAHGKSARRLKIPQ